MIDKRIYHLSTRIVSLSFRMNWHSISDISQYYSEHGTFMNLQGVGVKTNSELIAISRRYVSEIFENYSQLSEVQSDRKRLSENFELFRALAESQSSTLSVRARNVLYLAFNTGFLCEKNIDIIYHAEELKRLNGCGSKSAQELKEYLMSMTDLLFDLKSKHGENAEEVVTAAKLEVQIDLVEDIFALKVSYFIEKDLLYVLDKYLSQNLDQKELAIICEVFSRDYLNKNDAFESLAYSFNLTRERIRQIYSRLVTKLSEEVSELQRLISGCGIDLMSIYYDYGMYYGPSDKNFLNLPNSLLLGYMIELVPSLKIYRNSTDHRAGCVVFGGQYLGVLDIDAMIGLFEKWRERPLPVKFKLTEIVDRFAYGIEIGIEILGKIESLIRILYDWKCNEEGTYYLSANKKWGRKAQVHYVLSTYDSPMHLKDIMEHMNSLFLGKPVTLNGLRSIVLGNKDVFINTAWSTYGLKEWEDQGREIGGTVKEVVIKYLKSKEAPCHIHEIWKFVSKYRSASKRSIWSNIKIDPHEEFRIFRGGFVGLNEYEYSLKDTTFHNVSNKWLDHFVKNYTVANRSDRPLGLIIDQLSKDLRVSHIQIESLVFDRIEDGFLSKDGEDFIILNNVPKVDYEPLMEFLEGVDIKQLKDLMRDSEYTRAMEHGLAILERKGNSTSIMEVRRLLEYIEYRI